MGKKIEKPIECITEEEKKTNLRFRIMESAQHVKWVPAFGLSQELNWLNNMDDWMISKKRYWGLALPIWECHKCNSFEVIGSDDELKSKAVEGWEIFQGHTPHRPWIDAVKIKCSKCGSVISRISDVGNPWLDAGIVAYSTLNYRHNREYWKKWFPAELVAESLPGQFRNWFYAMLAMSTVLEGTAPFKVCFGHGDVLAEDGREMHKSWGNAIWFDDAVEIIGADVLRWLYLSSNPESNLLFGYKKADAVKRRFFIPLWNIYSFFVTYANIDNWQPPDLPKKSEMSPLDKWIMMKLGFLVEEVVHQIEEYSPINATIAIEKFVNSLSTWYLRRSRRRFWKTEKDDDKEVAYITLYTVLTALSKILAPFTPFIAEELYQNLIRKVSPDSAKSVHHTSWPRMKYVAEDTKLAAAMDLAIIVCEQGRSARSKARIKLRQPVSDIKIVAEKPVLEKLTLVKDIIANELNAKAIFLESNRTSLFRTSVRLLPQNIGKKYGRLFPKISAAFASLNPEDVVSTLRETHNLRFTIDNHEVVIPSKDIEISTVSRNEYSVCEYESIMVGVNRKIGSELKMEGFARDIVRRIQNQRKQANFNIEDSIETYYETDDETAIVFDVLGEYIASETLSIKMHKEHPPEEAHSATYVINDKHLTIGIILAKRK